MKTPLAWTKARRYADHIATALQPFCTRLEIAGSIRRLRDYCGDIDIVAEPRDEASLRARIAKAAHLIQNGPQNIHFRLENGIEVQVFLARPTATDLLETKPGNWGSLFLLRTGSREHNIYLLERAKALGLRWSTHEGVFDGAKLIASESEEAIFDALKLPFIEPRLRQR